MNRPDCSCHGVPMYEHRTRGYFYCKVKHDETVKRCRVKRSKTWARPKWSPTRRDQYGMTADDRRDMLVGQAGRCAICAKVADLVVDHDHNTGKIRGLLCVGCNTGIGQLGDSVSGIQRAVKYLAVFG